MLSRLCPTLLAAAIAVAVTPASHAQDANRTYALPAAPLAATLNKIASQAGVVLSVDPSLVAGRSAAPVQGQYNPVGAFSAALRGTGLQLVGSNGNYSVQSTQGGQALALPDVMINATGSGPAETAWGPTRGYLATRTAAGTKTDTAITELPRSVSVVTRDQMDDRPTQSLNDALRYSAGVISSGYGSDTRTDWLRIRGFEPTQFLDGLPLPRGAFANPKVEPWNLERIAVLRGPASSVYGQTPPGGLLDMVSRRPQAEMANQVEVQYGSDNHRQINLDTTGPIDPSNQFLYRLSGTVRDSDTQVDHIDNKRFNIAPSLKWNIDEDSSLTLISQFTRDRTGITSQFLPLQGTKLASPAGRVSLHKNLGEPGWDSYERRYYALGYAFEHRLNDVWQFRQNLRYTKSELDFQAVNVGTFNAVDADGNVNREAGIYDEDIDQFAVDNNFQADFDTGAVSHTLLLGLDHQRWATDYRWLYGSGVPPININRPVYGADLSDLTYFALQDYRQKTRQTGLYVQDQMALDQWRLTLGAREDFVRTGATFHNQGDATNTQRDNAFSGNVGLSYVFENGITPYLSYTESFQPAAGATISSTESFKPTEGRQYEAGVKYQLPESDTLLTAAVFDLRQENVSVTEGSVTSQVGEIKVRGLELEATGNVTENLKLQAAYTYTDSEILKGDDKGNRMAQIPRNQATAWADYTWRNGPLGGFGIGAGVRYVGDTYGNTANTWEGHVGSYTVYDTSAHYDLGYLSSALRGASLAVDAKNVFDKRYLSTCDGFWCYYGDERSVVASLKYRW